MLNYLGKPFVWEFGVSLYTWVWLDWEVPVFMTIVMLTFTKRKAAQRDTA